MLELLLEPAGEGREIGVPGAFPGGPAGEERRERGRKREGGEEAGDGDARGRLDAPSLSRSSRATQGRPITAKRGDLA